MSRAPRINPRFLAAVRRVNPFTCVRWDSYIHRWVWSSVPLRHGDVSNDIHIFELPGGGYRLPGSRDLFFIHRHTSIGKVDNFKAIRQRQLIMRARRERLERKRALDDAEYYGRHVGRYYDHRRHGVYLREVLDDV